MKYYIAENGQQAGPFEPAELLQHGLTVNSLVWCEGMANWTSASQVPELMALLSGQTTFNPGGIDMQLPPVPPVGQVNPLPQAGTQGNSPQPFPPTTYGQPTANRPYAQPQYGPNTNQPTNQLMPKTWLTESILTLVASVLCCFNIIGIVTGVVAVFKAAGIKNKFMKGDYTGANADSSSAKKWMLITLAVGVIWSLVQAFRLLTNPTLLQQIQEGTVGSLYGM